MEAASDCLHKFSAEKVSIRLQGCLGSRRTHGRISARYRRRTLLLSHPPAHSWCPGDVILSLSLSKQNKTSFNIPPPPEMVCVYITQFISIKKLPSPFRYTFEILLRLVKTITFFRNGFS